MIFFSTFRGAYLREYLTWLRGYAALGKQPTHHHDYPWARQNFLFARKDFTLGGECGSTSRSIVVKKGVRHLGGELGHNTLFFLEDSSVVGQYVPLFGDYGFQNIPGLEDFIERSKRERAQKYEERLTESERREREQLRTSSLTQYQHHQKKQ
jgi:hypothetical protein